MDIFGHGVEFSGEKNEKNYSLVNYAALYSNFSRGGDVNLLFGAIWQVNHPRSGTERVESIYTQTYKNCKYLFLNYLPFKTFLDMFQI